MVNICYHLDCAINVSDYINAIEKLMQSHGTQTQVNIEANHNNVEFFINGKVWTSYKTLAEA